MTAYVVRVEGVFLLRGCSSDELHSIGERVMSELLTLEGGAHRLTDSGVWTDSEQMLLGLEMSAPTSDDVDLLPELAIESAMRTALHAADVGTPEWRRRAVSRDEVEEPDLLSA